MNYAKLTPWEALGFLQKANAIRSNPLSKNLAYLNSLGTDAPSVTIGPDGYKVGNRNLGSKTQFYNPESGEPIGYKVSNPEEALYSPLVIYNTLAGNPYPNQRKIYGDTSSPTRGEYMKNVNRESELLREQMRTDEALIRNGYNPYKPTSSYFSPTKSLNSLLSNDYSLFNTLK